MDITPRKRAKIVALSENTDMSIRKIAEAVGVGKSSVSRLIKLQDDTGGVETSRKGRCGAKRKTTARDDALIRRISVLDPKKTSSDIKRDILSHGVDVDASTVRRRLLECGRRARRPVKKQLLTPLMMKKRLSWAKKYKDWTVEQWSKVFFSDETHFEVHGHRSKFVRRSPGEPLRPGHIQQAPKHPPKVMFWGCFTAFGPETLHPIDGMMNSTKYIDVLKRFLIPMARRRFPDGDVQFQQDLAPCHNSKLTKTFFINEKLTVMDWPGNSPDLNPIENLWGILKARICNLNCTTKIKMIESVIRLWFHDPEVKDMCKKLVHSMCKRVKDVIKAKGGHISY